MNTVASLPAKLLPFPFCGGEPEVYPGDRARSVWNACCGNGGCVTRGDNDYISEADAIAAWNRRALATPEQPSVLESEVLDFITMVPGDRCHRMLVERGWLPPGAEQPGSAGEGICKGTNCRASKANDYRHSSECLFDHARAVASGVESFTLGVTLSDDISYVNWRGQLIDLAAVSASEQAALERV